MLVDLQTLTATILAFCIIDQYPLLENDDELHKTKKANFLKNDCSASKCKAHTLIERIVL